jgi:gamma-glutamyltranspeptidase/glutathione hydrolase
LAAASAEKASVSAVPGRTSCRRPPTESDETAILGDRQRWYGRLDHLYTRRRVRLSRRCIGNGFILNNEMGDFNRVPSNRNWECWHAAHQIGGKAHAELNGSDDCVENGKVVLITARPGDAILARPRRVARLHGVCYNGRQAVDAPRINHQWMPDRGTVETDAAPVIPQSTLDALAAMGHSVARWWGSAH